MATAKKPALRSALNKSKQGAGSSALLQKKYIMYDVFDDEEVYNMHERYENEISSAGNGKAEKENRKRAFRNGNSGRGTDLKK